VIDPFRLKQSGGIAQRLLDSAGIDQPTEAARKRAEMLAATASSFSTTTPHQRRRERGAQSWRALLSWVLIGAAASVALAPVVVWFLDDATGVSAAATVAPGSGPPAATSSDGIAPEPKQGMVPGGLADEARDLEVARSALAKGDIAGALAALDAYDRAHPAGRLRAEAAALRARAQR